MARTDVHSPKNLRTEDYEFVACGWFSTTNCTGYSPLGPQGSAHYLLAEGWHFGENESAGVCYHCGQSNIIYYAILKHLPTHTLVRIGETCLENRFDRASHEFHRLRKQRRLNIEEITKKERRTAFDEAHPEVVADLEAFATAHPEEAEHGIGFMGSVHKQLRMKGELSVNQVAALERGIAKRKARAAEREEEAKNEPPASPCPVGKVAVTGKVLSVKWKESDYGGAFKMTVLSDLGFKVWGTVPESIHEAAVDRHLRVKDEDGLDIASVLGRGDRVSFTATIAQSGDDPCFGFFKRPTQGKLLAAES